MANGTTNQYSLIINSFGFTVLQTTLLGTVTGAVSFVSLSIAAIVLHNTKVSAVSYWCASQPLTNDAELPSMDIPLGLHTHSVIQHPPAKYEKRKLALLNAHC
jgi:hypothetical protein